jgi:hypothetical protein
VIDPDSDTTSYQSPHFDALALIRAQQRHNGQAVQRILDSADLPGLAMVLSQMVQTAINTQHMTTDQFLEMFTDKLVSKENSGP